MQLNCNNRSSSSRLPLSCPVVVTVLVHKCINCTSLTKSQENNFFLRNVNYPFMFCFAWRGNISLIDAFTSQTFSKAKISDSVGICCPSNFLKVPFLRMNWPLAGSISAKTFSMQAIFWQHGHPVSLNSALLWKLLVFSLYSLLGNKVVFMFKVQFSSKESNDLNMFKSYLNLVSSFLLRVCLCLSLRCLIFDQQCSVIFRSIRNYSVHPQLFSPSAIMVFVAFCAFWPASQPGFCWEFFNCLACKGCI